MLRLVRSKFSLEIALTLYRGRWHLELLEVSHWSPESLVTGLERLLPALQLLLSPSFWRARAYAWSEPSEIVLWHLGSELEALPSQTVFGQSRRAVSLAFVPKPPSLAPFENKQRVKQLN